MIDIYNTDCRNIANYAKPNSIQSVITSPPYYGQRDYGSDHLIWQEDKGCSHIWNDINPKSPFNVKCKSCGAWKGALGLEHHPEQYFTNLIEIFDCIRPCLKPDGTLWVNIGEGYYSGKMPGGSRMIDEMKKQDKYEDDWAKLDKKYKDEKHKARKFGVSPNHFTIDGYKSKDVMGIPWRFAIKMQENGWYHRDTIIWVKSYLSESNEIVGSCLPTPHNDRCGVSYEYIFLFAKEKRYYFNTKGIKTTTDTPARNTWYVPLERKRKVKHYATYPERLVENCLLLSTQPGDLVLDPFMGSGTTGLVCKNHSRRCIGFEVMKKYIDIAKERIN